MTYEVLIMPSAEGELEAAYLWISERAPQAAAAGWYNGAVDAILTLETFLPGARGRSRIGRRAES